MLQYGSGMTGKSLASELGDEQLIRFLEAARTFGTQADNFMWLFAKMCGLLFAKDLAKVQQFFNPFFADTVFAVFDAIRHICGSTSAVCVGGHPGVFARG